MKKLAFTVALLVAVALVGCGTSKPAGGSGGTSGGPGTIVQDAKSNASIVTCRTNRAQIDEQYAAAQSTGETPPDFAAVLQQSGAKCPSGGTYSWDAANGKTTCSIHGE